VSQSSRHAEEHVPVIYTKYLRCYDAEKFFETWLAIVDISGRKICTTIHRCELRGKPDTHWPPSSTRHSLETEFEVNEEKRGKKKQLPYNIRSGMKLGHENLFHNKK